MNIYVSKYAVKQADIDAKRYGFAEMMTCICTVVLTCCCISVLTYRIAVVLLCISVYLLTQRSKSMIIKRFAYINHYFFTYLNICINE